jgi:hypothetical protein
MRAGTGVLPICTHPAEVEASRGEIMKKSFLLSVASIIGGGSLLAGPAPDVAPTAAPRVCGDYVEARTASVFAGACHYNGEVVTIGHDAVAGWNITAGAWKGVDLSGVRAMAAITSDANLGETIGARHCELLIDSAASAAQSRAFADWIGSRQQTFGNVTAVRRGVVHFNHQGSTYAVTGDHFGSLNVQSMPNNECCRQPGLVWYAPLLALEHRKVGYTVMAAYDAGTLADPWQRGDENSAFYGSFGE